MSQNVVLRYKNDSTKAEHVVTDADPLPCTFGALSSTTDSISVPSPTTIGDGNKTVTTAGTAEKLITASTPCSFVVVTALLANTGQIAVGGSTCKATSTVRGDILAAGDSTVISIDNVNKVYINSTVNTEGVSFRYQL